MDNVVPRLLLAIAKLASLRTKAES